VKTVLTSHVHNVKTIILFSTICSCNYLRYDFRLVIITDCVTDIIDEFVTSVTTSTTTVAMTSPITTQAPSKSFISHRNPQYITSCFPDIPQQFLLLLPSWTPSGMFVTQQLCITITDTVLYLNSIIRFTLGYLFSRLLCSMF
jgi:hypothetical protein